MPCPGRGGKVPGRARHARASTNFFVDLTNSFVYAAVVPRNPSTVPTDAELAILRVLWSRGPGTVRDVLGALNAARPARGPRGATGYTTVLKTLQIMTDKGLVARDERERTHVYRAARTARDTQRKLVRHLLDRAFGGAAHQLVLHALDAARSSPAEMAEIRRLLERHAQTSPQHNPTPTNGA